MKLIIGVIIDLVFLIISFVIPEIIEFYYKPFKRGFFCDDDSLKYPIRGYTVDVLTLFLVATFLPIALIIIVEIARFCCAKRYVSDTGSRFEREYELFCYELPAWLTNSYRYIGIFLFGASIEAITRVVTKYTIGRLRPHFFSLCQPIMPDGTDCSNPINQGRYIEAYNCSGNASARALNEMRQSFPSGHSSIITFAMIYSVIYLQTRVTRRGPKLPKHCIQLVLIIIALYTALSRISDYNHHWSDVLGGVIFGAVWASITTIYVASL